MAFSSQLMVGEPIINDDPGSWDFMIPPPGQSRGLELGRSTPYGESAAAPPFPTELLIPKSEWQARIQEKEERKNRLSDLSLRYNLPCKDQGQTNYCWINAPTYCVEIMRLVQNQEMILLSPASAGAPIKGFRNVGGWGLEALEYIQEHGLCPVANWPANAISRQYYTAENRELAKQFRPTTWWELRPRNMEHLVSCLLRNIPVAGGYNWWRHEITNEDAIWLDGTIAVRIRNSWGMGWGTNGYGILQGSRMYADDQVAPVAVTARAPAPENQTAEPAGNFERSWDERVLRAVRWVEEQRRLTGR